MREIIYLCVPYSHPDPSVREFRFRAANRAAGHLLAQGDLVYSPISHSHPIAMENGTGLGWETWRDLDLEMLRRCDRMVVLMLPGWQKSEGIKAELRAASGNIPVEWFEPEGMTHANP